MFSTLIFTWLHNQKFYKDLQKEAIKFIPYSNKNQTWADIGCSTGLMSRLAHKLNYDVIGYDINSFSLFIARLLSFNLKNIKYKKKDFQDLETKFDVITATSLLSVVDNKEEALNKLISLLKDNNSTLIIIEPSEKLSVLNTWKQINSLKTFWFYKGLLLWAKARENKAIDNRLFKNLKGIKVTQKYYLGDMVCVTYLVLNNH